MRSAHLRSKAQALLDASAEAEHLDTGEALEIIRALADCGEGWSPDGPFYCPDCGSDQIETYAVGWVPMNADLTRMHVGEVEDLHTASCYSDTYWCPDCDRNPGCFTTEKPEAKP